MTNDGWLTGLRELLAAFPDRETEPEIAATRGEVYRRELNALTDETWLYAVRECVRHERWFPTVAAILDYASDAPEPAKKALGPPPEFGDREAFRRGYEEVFKPALKAHGIDPDAAVGRFPEAKLEKAREQARQIVEESEVRG